MKKNLPEILIALMLTAVSCSQKPLINSNKALVDSLMTTLNSAWNSQNPDQVLDLFTEDGMMIFPDVTVSGRDSLSIFFRQEVPDMRNFSATAGLFSVSDSLITVLGPYSYDWQGPENISYPQQGSGNIYWRKTREGKWKIFLEVDHQASVIR